MKDKIFCEILAISIGLLIVAITIVGSANATNNTTHIVINAFDQNPEGKGYVDHGNEWVTLYNPTNSSVNISGWTISSIKYRGGIDITIKNSTIPPKSYWTYIHDKGWLHDEREQIRLNDSEGHPIDKTLVASDGSMNNDNRYWARYPVCFDTDSDSDWRFGLQTLEEGVMRRGTVRYVRDGDTIYISPVTSNATNFLTSTNNGGTIYISPVAMAGVQSVRLVCIDAPELGTQKGKESKTFLEGLCLGKEVEFDVDDCRHYDKHNRILALVYLNGTKLNEEMLRNDYADFLYIPFSEFVPHANFTYSPPNPVVNQSIVFNASSSQTLDPDAAIMRPYEWDFGDGTNGTGKIVNHTYPSPGNYVASLKVTDSNGDERRSNIRNKTITVNIPNMPPIASFIYSPLNPIVNRIITFDGSNSTDPDGTIEEYEWDFGDGEKAEGSIVIHSYSFAGNYTVKLTVTDDDNGAVDSTTEPIHVAGPPTVSVINPPKVSEGENFTATVNIDNAKGLAILLFKLTYDPSVTELTNVERGSGASDWSHWYSSQKTGTLKIFAFSDPSGLPINGDAELAKIEFEVVGKAGDKSAIDIQGIIGNSDVEPIESKWIDSEVTVI